MLGLENLAAPDVAGYVRVATELAADLPRLRALRQTLRERCRSSALCDGASLARALEAVPATPADSLDAVLHADALARAAAIPTGAA